ncbi:hypothetical protein BB8028_0002g03100 [Beauveria bassiana]|uniref:Uncharacterized protein n=1 Tax=Beauveria bassiana TaxID=176275 RepID=A0A2S7Y1G1_BEABA|nr:hypothetical protein BB8028_0002g03100 [Beauveria bassiana]
MAKLQPVLTIEEMEQQLGYKLDAKSEALEANSLLYSDLTLFVADLHQRTLREYEMFEKGLDRCHKAVPAAIAADCREKVILSENDSITLRRSNLTGFYQYFANVQDNSGLAIQFLLTADESLAIAAVTELERSGTEATISQVQKHDSALLSLPVEIRQYIYKHVLGNRCWYIAEPKIWRRHTFCRALGDPSGFYFPFGEADTLLRVSKQVRRQALPVAYQGTAMHVVDIDGATALLMAIGRIGRDNMTSFQLGWESYADTQLNWSKPEIPEKMHLMLPRLHVPTCIYLLKQCPRLANLSLTFNNFFMEDVPLPAFQSDPGIRLCCSIRNIKRLSITDSAGEALDDEAAAKWLKEELLGS